MKKCIIFVTDPYPLGLGWLDGMKTGNRHIDSQLIKQAQLGQRESLAQLTELAQRDIYAFLYRMTLDDHLAQDLCQDTLMQIVKSLPQAVIENKDMFWAWTYKIAVSKVTRHFRLRGNKRIEHATRADSEQLKGHCSTNEDGLHHLMRQELGQVISKAMDQLTPHYRGILALRCFNQLSYAQIATIMGSTDLRVRVAFFRARQALRQQLKRSGYKKMDLLPALGLFAAFTCAGTSKTATAASVSTSTLHVGGVATALATLGSKLGVTASALVCISVLTLSTTARIQESRKTAYQSTINTVSQQLGERIQAVIRNEIDNFEFVHLALIQDTNLISVRAYGSDADIHRPCRYASVSKAVTSVLVMKMLEQGQLRSLDDNVWDT
ncbi:sigma-70 family RNA polymerase sigma factor, partial [Planctomycetota bacterium]